MSTINHRHHAKNFCPPGSTSPISASSGHKICRSSHFAWRRFRPSNARSRRTNILQSSKCSLRSCICSHRYFPRLFSVAKRTLACRAFGHRFKARRTAGRISDTMLRQMRPSSGPFQFRIFRIKPQNSLSTSSLKQKFADLWR
jgi:hypothetical protein